ncbi:potassium-transporting ATPase subunit KdpC [Uliginosibacterium sp. 31-12]|uniref:potassium-transporting ATPase subunit KdpC n=1 Tax=Uliginosibacterium sp. 31-12 TaxID=3062781 RepID=UPI0026E1F8DB|nr:potassium-transporting ATPase subunit KdpC [Uliginosibacterium sp. 31-12]MDO6385429.1 potassium-transporting ATPase subunit KdpC [Uliginosibacterium sp. 31-12]
MNATTQSQSIWHTLLAELRPAASLFLALTLITGAAYPLLITGIAQGLFPHEANGSLILKDGKTVGSELIGQPFSDAKYLWGRPSATGPQPYNALASSGSNLGPLNPALVDTVKARIAEERTANPAQTGLVPQELVTASASGLDPHISPGAARWQVARIAQVRGLPAERVQAIIEACSEQPAFGLFGEARVNVLQVNLALDALK